MKRGRERSAFVLRSPNPSIVQQSAHPNLTISYRQRSAAPPDPWSLDPYSLQRFCVSSRSSPWPNRLPLYRPLQVLVVEARWSGTETEPEAPILSSSVRPSKARAPVVLQVPASVRAKRSVENCSRVNGRRDVERAHCYSGDRKMKQGRYSVENHVVRVVDSAGEVGNTGLWILGDGTNPDYGCTQVAVLGSGCAWGTGPVSGKIELQMGSLQGSVHKQDDQSEGSRTSVPRSSSDWRCIPVRASRF